MSEEKTTPPAYSMPEDNSSRDKSSSRKWLFGLLFYAGAVTAALITVSVIGSIYLNNIQQQHLGDEVEERGADIKNYEIDSKDGTGKEDIAIDRTNNREIIHFKGANGKNDSWMVLDFQKNLGAMYDGNEDYCYIFGDLDSGIPDARTADDLLSQGDDDSEDKRSYYDVDTTRQVEDLSLLPRELYSLCWGKHVFWAEPRKEGDDEHGRQKRDVYWCHYVGNGWWHCHLRTTYFF